MAVFRPLSDEDLDQIARSYSFGAIAEAAPVPQGSINTNYRIRCDRGRFFLRHSTVRGLPEHEFEAALLEHLSRGAFPGPRIEPTSSGALFWELGGGWVTVFHFLPGDEIGQADVEVDHAEELGRLIGKLHRVANSFPRSRANPYRPEVVRGWLEGLKRNAEPEVAHAALELQTLLDRVEAHGAPLVPRGIIHADLFTDNVKWLGKKVSAIFDFEMACTDAWVLDLAIALNAWAFRGDYDWRLARALVRGYEEVRRLEPSERNGVHAALLFGAIRFCASRIRDFHLSPLSPERLLRKDYRTYLARVRALGSLDPRRLAERLF